MVPTTYPSDSQRLEKPTRGPWSSALELGPINSDWSSVRGVYLPANHHQQGSPVLISEPITMAKETVC